MKTLIKNTNVEEVLIQFFGETSWIDPFEDDEFDETHVLYAVYNDDIADGMQIGTIKINYVSESVEVVQEII